MSKKKYEVVDVLEGEEQGEHEPKKFNIDNFIQGKSKARKSGQRRQKILVCIIAILLAIVLVLSGYLVGKGQKTGAKGEKEQVKSNPVAPKPNFVSTQTETKPRTPTGPPPTSPQSAISTEKSTQPQKPTQVPKAAQILKPTQAPKPSPPPIPPKQQTKPVAPSAKEPVPPPAKEPVKGTQTSAEDLQKISEHRRQQQGISPVVPGTVSQLEYLKKNKNGNTIDQVLYTQALREERKKFHEQRIRFVNSKKNFQSIYLVSFNNKLDTSRDEEQARVQAEQYRRIDNIWHFDKYPEELPMCVVAPGYNNNARFRIQYNLNSMFTQNYTNYFVVVINDASNDGSDDVYRKYFDFYDIDKKYYAYISNTERKTALENIYTATRDYCSPDSIVVTLDADDEFIGKNVLKIFNAGYQLHKAGVVYSNFYFYEQDRNVMYGFTSQYSEVDKQNRNYRQAAMRFSHLRSYRTQLFLQIKDKDFKDQNGKFWTSAYDMVMFFPLMELSCGRVQKIPGVHYLYNTNTGLNDYAVDRGKQARIDQTVRRQPKYECSKEFDAKMNAL